MSDSQLDAIEAAADQLLTLGSRLRGAQSAQSVDGLLEVLRVSRDLQKVVAPLAGPVVAVLRQFDISWLEIASALGLSRQSVWDRYHAAEGGFGELEERLVAMTRPTVGRSGRQLEVSRVYTRVELQCLFSIKDATIKNGVFHVKDRHEIWLFVTERKTADRTQYQDELVGDDLRWQGQTFGRTDALVISHRQEGNDILVFYRKAKNEFPGSGFRLEGSFDYMSHSGNAPTSFVLKRRTDDGKHGIPIEV
jgi:hypothetical protein